MEQVKAGLDYLNTSLIALNADIAIIQAKFPDKYCAMIAQVQPMMAEAETDLSQAAMYYASSDMSQAVNCYDLARPLLGTMADLIQQVCGTDDAQCLHPTSS